jgi:hypothetical protein
MSASKTTFGMAIVSAMTIVLFVHAPARSAGSGANAGTVLESPPDGPDRPPALAVPAAPTGVVLNGFAIRGAFPRRIEPASPESGAAPLTGAQLLLLGKDKIGGNVHLTWSGGAPPYVLQRWGNIIPSGGSTILPSPPTATAYDDPVLFDGINECWLVD